MVVEARVRGYARMCVRVYACEHVSVVGGVVFTTVAHASPAGPGCSIPGCEVVWFLYQKDD